MAAATERATKAREEALSGVPFETLVIKYSDDLPSKAVGGDRGWISKGKGDSKFDAAVFATPKGNITEIIEASYGFEIVKVDDRKDASIKPLEEVRDAIITEIRRLEAPAYAAAKAREIAQAARASSRPLTEVAKDYKLPVKSSPGLLEMGKDPEETLAGVTDLALNLPLSDRLLPTSLDVGDLAVIIQTKEFKEPTTAPLDEVKGQIATSLKNSAARKLAEQRANELLAAVKAAGADFKRESDIRKATALQPVAISRAKADAAPTSALPSALRTSVFATSSPAVLDRVFQNNGSYIVAAVTQIKKPDVPTAKDAMAKYREQASEGNSRRALESAVAFLKASAELDIDQTLLVNQ
jgi:hypothetical protein